MQLGVLGTLIVRNKCDVNIILLNTKLTNTEDGITGVYKVATAK